jgi:hypothetical protein
MAERDLVPDVLTIEEAALVLRVGRTAAYEQARVWRETGGKAGIPNIEVGGQYRVPTGALAEMIGRPITHIPESHPRRRPEPQPPERNTRADVRELRSARRPGARLAPSAGQGALPL